ncbi:gliding motility-associated C-terminal domain-containing protein [Aquimarina sp. 2-A2]|uniref:T9SS type B sorting domain-containing protein n=1 Tax=Aquimarina sp. 2-A2 TaxID=3382644 RepID=UPI00387F1360
MKKSTYLFENQWTDSHWKLVRPSAPLLLLIFLTLAVFTNVQAQNFTWETGIDNGNTVSETVNGVTATVSSSSGNVGITDARGHAGSTGKIVFEGEGSETFTIAFDSPLDIESIFAIDLDRQGGNTWVFTPTGGFNSVVTEPVGSVGETVTLNWTNVTVITITITSGGRENYGVDDIILSPPNTAPAIGGTLAGQAVNDDATIVPFSTITVADADGDNLSATITLDNNAKGILSGTGLTGTGPYTIASTTPANLQAILRALSFDPTDNRSSTSETTTFTVVVDDGNDIDTDNTTTVISSAVAPTITSVMVPSNATYIAGQNLDFTINFDENITANTAGGTPQLAITIGATTRQATYQSGSGSSALLFRYTVQAGDLDTNGIAVGALSANGGTFRDSGGMDANLTLNSVGSTTAVLVDAAGPIVTSVNVPANWTYIAGQNLNFTVNTNENVTVNTGGGIPQLAIAIGATTRQAVYQSGSGSSTLLFRYTVQTGELDTDGIAIGTLAANGGTLRDAVGNNLNTTLNSVGNTTAVLVDAVAPTVTSVTVPANATYIAGQNLDFTINFNESITVNTGGGTPQLAITIGATTRQATYQSGSGTAALLFRYTVQAGELDTDGITIGTLAANGGTLRDAASNNANATLNAVGATTAVLVEAVAPTVTSVTVPSDGIYNNGSNLTFTVIFNENITVDTTGGTPELAITIGSTVRQAVFNFAFGNRVSFRYRVQAGELDTDGITIGTLSANGGTLRDAAGNDANLALNSVGNTSGVLVDAVAPIVTSVTVPADATYITGENLDFTVNFNENIFLTSTGETPSEFSITIGTSTRYARFLSASSPTSLIYRYTVRAGDLDTDGIAIENLRPYEDFIGDTAGNEADLTLNSVGNTSAVFVNGVPPTVTSVSVPANATYTTGENLDFMVNTDENVTVNTVGGTPQLSIIIGTTTRQAIYQSGSGTSAMLFRYTVQSGEQDTDGIVVGALSANGGTLKSAIGNNLDTTLNSVGSTIAVLVDTVAPTGYSVVIDQSPINADNQTSVSYTFDNAEVGTTYNYTFITSGGIETVTGSGIVGSTGATITGIDLSGLTDGTITLNVTLTDTSGNIGSVATDTETKDTASTEPVTVNIMSTATSPVTEQDLPILITITFSTSVIDFEEGDILLSNASLENFEGTGDTYTFDLIPTAEGVATVDVSEDVTQDADGNMNIAAAQFAIDYVIEESELETLLVPKGFSPNGDGINDTWVIEGNGELQNIAVKVFNRWGAEVFSAESYENDWDGTSNGKTVLRASNKLPVGAYYYVITALTTNAEPITGWIYINY